MAAEALTTAAANCGHEIKVETQGSVGAKNQLTERGDRSADVVIIAADTHVDLARFAGKPLYSDLVRHGPQAGAAASSTTRSRKPAPPGAARSRPGAPAAAPKGAAAESEPDPTST